MLICEICGKECKTKSGLSGHKRLAHHSESSSQSTEGSASERSNEHLADRSELTPLRIHEEFEGLLEGLRDVHEQLDDALVRSKEALERSKAMHSEQFTQELAEHLDRIMLRRHLAGLCGKVDCHLCRDQRSSMMLDALERIEERVPGTREALATWELDHEEIEIIE